MHDVQVEDQRRSSCQDSCSWLRACTRQVGADPGCLQHSFSSQVDLGPAYQERCVFTVWSGYHLQEHDARQKAAAEG